MFKFNISHLFFFCCLLLLPGISNLQANIIDESNFLVFNDCDDELPDLPLPYVRSFMGREFTISEFNINNSGTNNVYVDPGSTVTVSLDWNSIYTSTYCPGCIQQFYVGLESTVECLYSGGTNYPRSDSRTFSFTAPTTDGTYYFKASSSLQYFCTPPGSYPNTEELAIGSIVVTTPPTAICTAITVELDENGTASIQPEDVDGGSSDNCGIANMSLSTSDFDCNDVIPNITLPVVRNYANRTFTIPAFSINDSGINNVYAAPGSTITVSLDWTSVYGNPYCPGCIQQYYVGLGSTVECLYSGNTLGTRSGSRTFSFTAPAEEGTYYFHSSSSLQYYCTPPSSYSNKSENAIGSIVVTNTPPSTELTVTDAAGNTATCTANVTVHDNIPPVVITNDITVHLDEAGNATITADEINNGSNDACGIALLEVTPNTFDCGDVGENSVTLSATDNNGNQSSATATVTVIDDVPPVAICQDISVSPNEDGSYTIIADEVDNGSADACGIIDVQVIPDFIPCFHEAAVQTVELVVTDANLNTTSCTANVYLLGDEDCDGVGDYCDVCPGGDDQIDANNDGLPDCANPPAFDDIIDAWKCGSKKVYMCHVPPGNPENAHTICVNKNAIAAHIAHGDYLGFCGNASCESEARLTNRNEQSSQEQSLQTQTTLKLFPNPAGNRVTLSVTPLEHNASIVIYNYTGKVVWSTDIAAGNSLLNIDLSAASFVNGIYLVSLVTETDIVSHRLVVNK